MQGEGWHLTPQHTSKHQNKFVYLKAGSFFTYKMRAPCISLALMMISPFLHTKSTLAGVSAPKWKSISQTTEACGLLLQRMGNMAIAPQGRWWVCCGSQMMQMHHSSKLERWQGSRQKTRGFSILTAMCIKQLILPGECPGEHRVIVSTLWFAAGHVSGRERKNLSVKV